MQQFATMPRLVRLSEDFGDSHDHNQAAGLRRWCEAARIKRIRGNSRGGR
jgi:hypothetical protein